MKLSTLFDAVVMLTWSDWQTEPRSNRYHFATRFAKHMPVLFVQHSERVGGGVKVRPSEVKNLDLVDMARPMGPVEVAQIRQLLHLRGIRHPLLWVYDPIGYKRLIADMPQAFLSVHATEDYFEPSDNWASGIEIVRDSMRDLLQRADFLVTCSNRVARSYFEAGAYKGPSIVSENGCDTQFFERVIKNFMPGRTQETGPVAIFQGGINQRLDYPLLLELAKRLPHWTFRFVGNATDSPAWRDLLARENVSYGGSMGADELACEMLRADAGLIPYKQSGWIWNSLPLKAYEYVACGLPVVTVPIEALADTPELFQFARTAEAFALELEASIARKSNQELVAMRAEAARQSSYDVRFDRVVDRIVELAGPQSRVRTKRLTIAILYDANSVKVSTIREHLDSFREFGRHDYYYIPATVASWEALGSYRLDISLFDAVVLHYSVRLPFPEYFQSDILSSLCTYRGLKIGFAQDEYERPEVTRQMMEQIGFDLFFTCVPMDQVDRVYPLDRFSTTEFHTTLTGYVADKDCSAYVTPLFRRRLHIAYRGRKLPRVYGKLGEEKAFIGVAVKKAAEKRSIPVDIDVSEESRIYGDDWYRFLGSARATLGTESGSNVFDFTSEFSERISRIEADPAKTDAQKDEEIREILKPLEGMVKMNQISPKIFEAIRLKTALVLFEGAYSGVIERDRHFIPLKKDLSNIEEVFEKIADDTLIARMTDDAYNDIVASGRYSYESFVEDFETKISAVIRRKIVQDRYSRLLVGERGSTGFELATPLLPSRAVTTQDLARYRYANTGIAWMLVWNFPRCLTRFVWSKLKRDSRSLAREVYNRLPDPIKPRVRVIWQGRPSLHILWGNLKHRVMRAGHGIFKRLPPSLRERLRPYAMRIMR